MHRLAVSCVALLLAACASAPPQPASLAEDIRAGRIDPSAYDFGALRFSAGGDPTALDNLATTLNADAHLNSGCTAETLHIYVAQPWLSLAVHAPDAATYAQDHAALVARAAAIDAQLAAFDRGEAPADASSAATGFQRDARTTADPRARELFLRAGRDQIIRSAFTDRTLGEGLSDAAREAWTGYIGTRMATTDCDDTGWLSAQLQSLDWFDIPTFGERADNAAWLIVQHADRSRPFQRDILTRLQRLAPSGATNAKNLAYLTDRVAIANGELQSYGTQGRCMPDGAWQAFEIVDAANVDARRQAVGLVPLAQYAAVFTERGLCPRPVAPPAPH